MSALLRAGGSIREGQIYIERPADKELLAFLSRGEYCYVLAPRQIGKSSLAVQTRSKLTAKGVRCVAVDLNRVGTQATMEEWYCTTLKLVAKGLELEVRVDDFWEKHAQESLPARWVRFCEEVMLAEVKAPVVVFMDEIDSILSAPAVANDFFASLRTMHEMRLENPAFERLTFCLLGVAAPRELMQDEARTPFNIGRAVPIEDFTAEEAERLLPGLEGLGQEPRALLEAILSWTDGHPYMTQRVALALAETGQSEGKSAQAWVEECVQRLFLVSGRQDEPNLRYAEDRFVRKEADEQAPKMLRVYRQLLEGQAVASVGSDRVQQGLRLTGMVAERRDAAGRWLRVRNRVFATVFNAAWVREKEADRLLAEPLRRWLEAGRSEDLLRGEVLKQAQEWARGREDLTGEEREFVEASREHEDSVLSASYSPDGRSIVAASADNTARVWEAGSGKLQATLKGHEGRVWSASYSPDGKSIVTASDDKTVQMCTRHGRGRLAALLRGIPGQVGPSGRAHVVLAGDIVDFLAEQPFSAFTDVCRWLLD